MMNALTRFLVLAASLLGPGAGTALAQDAPLASRGCFSLPTPGGAPWSQTLCIDPVAYTASFTLSGAPSGEEAEYTVAIDAGQAYPGIDPERLRLGLVKASQGMSGFQVALLQGNLVLEMEMAIDGELGWDEAAATFARVFVEKDPSEEKPAAVPDVTSGCREVVMSGGLDGVAVGVRCESDFEGYYYLMASFGGNHVRVHGGPESPCAAAGEMLADLGKRTRAMVKRGLSGAQIDFLLGPVHTALVHGRQKAAQRAICELPFVSG
jgi:hypothetical protein